MNKIIEGLASLVETWKNSGNFVYQSVGCIAAILTIVTIYTGGQRPNESMANFMRSMGVSGAGDWFDYGLPSFLAQPGSHIKHVLAFSAGMVVLAMLTMPFVSARRGNWPIEAQVYGLLGSRIACSAWILLMFAAQFGTLVPAAAWLRSRVTTVASAVLITALVGVILVMALFCVVFAAKIENRQKYCSGSDVFNPLKVLIYFSLVVLMGVLSLIFVVLRPILSALSWLLETESDSMRESRARELSGETRLLQPTGAKLPSEISH
ncbi:hypothetical protein [Cutibacterium granulosum]|uniref:hypothetical protein n=1 Tax=Cutibacterium granulosum TaxID=33011 RepID=UPI0023F63A47|nr:hypothetical protein [Cutibacterium granulosum]